MANCSCALHLATMEVFEESLFIMSLLIPKPTFLRNDIDVYLQPLVDELKEVWETYVLG